MSFIVLASVVAVASGTFDYCGKATIEDVKSFFKKDVPTVLFMRTYSRQVSGRDTTCIFTTNIGSTQVELLQGYKRSEETVNYRLHVSLSRGELADDAPVMTAVRHEDAHGRAMMKRKYRFHYYESEAQCAVIAFTEPQGSTKCEIQVWLAKAKTGPSINCRREYSYLCPNSHNYIVHKRECSYPYPWEP